jgi:hypothetical protein
MKYSKRFYENQEQVQAQSQVQGQESQGQSDEKVELAKDLIKNQKNLATFIQKFGTIANDEKVQKFLEAAEDLDKIKSKEVPGIPAVSLIPSQQEVGLGNSVADLISNPGWDSTGEKTDKELELILGDTPVKLTDKGGNLIVVAKCPGTTSDEDKFWVIDGHHRWSKAAVANPNVKLTCIVFEPAEGSGLDIIGVLKAFHIANFKIKKESPTEPLSGDNLLNCEDQKIKDFVNNTEKSEKKLEIWKNKKGVSDWNGVTEMLLDNRTKLADARKSAPIKSEETPTPRTSMPQVGDTQKVKTELGTPKINVHVESRIIKTYEKFMQNWENNKR